MPYATRQDIIDRDREDDFLVVAGKDDGTLNETAVDNALVDTTEEMDLYIAKKYDLPLPNVPAILKRLCISMTLYQLGLDALGNTEEKRQRYDDAIKLLKQIAKGEVELAIVYPEASDADPSEDGESSDSIEITSAPRLFSRDSMSRVL